MVLDGKDQALQTHECPSTLRAFTKGSRRSFWTGLQARTGA